MTDFPPLDTKVITGDLGFHQHPGGHTSGPAWETFYLFASKYSSTSRARRHDGRPATFNLAPAWRMSSRHARRRHAARQSGLRARPAPSRLFRQPVGRVPSCGARSLRSHAERAATSLAADRAQHDESQEVAGFRQAEAIMGICHEAEAVE